LIRRPRSPPISIGWVSVLCNSKLCPLLFQRATEADVQLGVVGQQRLGPGDRRVAELEPRPGDTHPHRVVPGVPHDRVERQGLRARAARRGRSAAATSPWSWPAQA
jgi:hypothetical protein